MKFICTLAKSGFTKPIDMSNNNLAINNTSELADSSLFFRFPFALWGFYVFFFFFEWFSQLVLPTSFHIVC